MIRNPDMLDDDRGVLTPNEVYSGKGPIIVPERLDELDSADLVGAGQSQNSISHIALHCTYVLNSSTRIKN